MCCYVLLLAAIYYPLLLFAAFCCCFLLSAASCCSLLLFELFVAMYCTLLLFAAICCFLLLFAALCCYSMLFAASCCLFLIFVAFCWCWLIFPAVCCSLGCCLLRFCLVCFFLLLLLLLDLKNTPKMTHRALKIDPRGFQKPPRIDPKWPLKHPGDPQEAQNPPCFGGDPFLRRFWTPKWSQNGPQNRPKVYLFCEKVGWAASLAICFQPSRCFLICWSNLPLFLEGPTLENLCFS